ncbi:MAG: hypothetical protein ACRD2R_09830 [Terriglobales bacterium]
MPMEHTAGRPSAVEAARAGLQATWEAKWMVFLFFACNLLLAAAVAAPMHSAIADHLGRSQVGEELARGFSAAWLTEFQIAYQDFLKGFSIAIIYGGILFLALNTVLAAGAFEVFAAGQGARLHAFGRGVGKYFARFVRVALAASAMYFLAFWLWNDLAVRGLDRWFQDSTREYWHFYLNWTRAAMLFFSVVTVNLLVEYARADIVTRERASSMAALGRGAGFILRKLPQVLAIYLGLGTLTALTILVYATFARFFPQQSGVTVLVWFLVAQALLWARWMFRLSSWGAAVRFYGVRPAPEV